MAEKIASVYFCAPSFAEMPKRQTLAELHQKMVLWKYERKFFGTPQRKNSGDDKVLWIFQRLAEEPVWDSMFKTSSNLLSSDDCHF